VTEPDFGYPVLGPFGIFELFSETISFI